LRLYCPQELLPQIVALVESGVARGAAWRREQRLARPRSGFFLRWAALTSLALLAAMFWFRDRPGFSLSWASRLLWAGERLPSLALVSAALLLLAGARSGWLGRAFSVPAALCGGLLVYRIGSLELRTFETLDGDFFFRGYEFEPAGLAISLLGALALLAMSMARLLGMGEGRRASSKEVAERR
jgi:hypothetical protein